MPRKSLIALATLVVLHGAALASGGSPEPAPPASAPAETRSPEQQATGRYNEGLKHEEKAKKLAAEAEAAAPGKREKIEASARKEYEKAMKEFQAAVEDNPAMFQAHSGLGHALRSLGSYEEALAAYDQALKLEPHYSPAVEYRAEAYLGLNRLDDAKSAYMSLFTGDRKRADELQAAMKKWLDKHRQDPGGVSPEVIDEFAKWLAVRSEIAGQTSALTQPENDRW